MVSAVIRSHPCIVVVSLIGAVAGVVWTAICTTAFVGVYMKWGREHQDLDPAQQCALLFLASFAFVVGGQVVHHVCHVTYCGIFGRWYYGRDQEGGVLGRSLRVALTTSFGSICCGAFLIALLRALLAVVRWARRRFQGSSSLVCCLPLSMLECVIACVGDILEYFSEWAYVQVAVRGTSLLESARITQSLNTCANMKYVISDLLIDSVVYGGALVCSLVGGGVGAGVGAALGGGAAEAGGIAGFLAGALAGGATAGIISSGAKTILALWAENPAPLQQLQPDIHQDFEKRILGKVQFLAAGQREASTLQGQAGSANAGGFSTGASLSSENYVQ